MKNLQMTMGLVTIGAVIAGSVTAERMTIAAPHVGIYLLTPP